MDSRRREIVPDEESSESINDDVNDSDTVSDSSTVSSSHDSPSGQRDAATGTLQDRSRINARKRDRSPTSPRTYEFESIREGTLKGELISKTHAPVTKFDGVCGLNGCTSTFRNRYRLITHQEGPSHLAIPYYCPLTSEHCPRAPCPRAQGGSGGPFVGRHALYQHLSRNHAGHTAAAAGLNLSWNNLVAFRVKDQSAGGRTLHAAASVLAPPSSMPAIVPLSLEGGDSAAILQRNRAASAQSLDLKLATAAAAVADTEARLTELRRIKASELERKIATALEAISAIEEKLYELRRVKATHRKSADEFEHKIARAAAAVAGTEARITALRQLKASSTTAVLAPSS